MNKIFLLSLISAISIYSDTFAQNTNQNGMLQVQEIYDEGEAQTMPMDNNVQVQAPSANDNDNDNDSAASAANKGNINNEGQLTVEETVEAEGIIEND